MHFSTLETNDTIVSKYIAKELLKTGKHYFKSSSQPIFEENQEPFLSLRERAYASYNFQLSETNVIKQWKSDGQNSNQLRLRWRVNTCPTGISLSNLYKAYSLTQPWRRT